MADKTDVDGYDPSELTIHATAGSDADPDAFLVETPDGEFTHFKATPANQALFGEGRFADVAGTNAFTDLDGTVIELTADPVVGDYRLAYGDDPEVQVPDDYIDEVVDTVTSPVSTAETAQKLGDLYREIIAGRVRPHVAEIVAEHYSDDRVELVEDGIEIDDTFIVTREAENHLLYTQPGDPYADSDLDTSKQAVYFDFDTDDERSVTVDGTELVLTETEQQFLTQVEALLYPEDYFGVELVDEVLQHKQAAEARTSLDDLAQQLADNADDVGFTDPKTGNHHGSSNHSFQKHRLSDLGVTDEAADLLWANDFDHAGVHEMALRKDELLARPDVTLFEDAPDDDPDKWDKIERTRENAPIRQKTKRTLQDMYGE